MIDGKAYTQVNYIIQNMSKELKNKIPKELIDIIEKNKDNEYKIEADNVEDLELLDDAKKVLSVIYTDYIASDEEKLIIKNKERLINLKKEEEKRKKYDIDVFKKQNIDKKLTESENLEITIIAKDKWYIRVFKKLKSLFRK